MLLFNASLPIRILILSLPFLRKDKERGNGSLSILSSVML